MGRTLLLNDQFWSGKYQNQLAGWDIGHASPPLTNYLSQLTAKDIRILIPGCGNAWEAAWLLHHGFKDITLLDISAVVTASLRQRYKDTPLQIIHGDFFDHAGMYDLILEQTFFCALLPHHRQAYVLKMKSLLKPAGKLAGLLFGEQFEGGPPFGGSKEEYQQLFEPHFKILAFDTCYNSIAPRKNRELFLLAQKPIYV
jgi:methyl halide transferase